MRSKIILFRKQHIWYLKFRSFSSGLNMFNSERHGLRKKIMNRWKCFRIRGRLNIKISYQYRDPHLKDKTISRPSYLKHGNAYTWERWSFYWDGAQVIHMRKLEGLWPKNCWGVRDPNWFLISFCGSITHYKIKKRKMELVAFSHYNDAIMGAIASQITSLTIIFSTVYSQSSASLAFVRGIHRGP